MAELETLAKTIAQQAGLDPALVCAVVEQESSWDPKAKRYEPGFYERYIVPLTVKTTEGHLRAFSWGLMQVMGQVARELGFKGDLTDIQDPMIGLTLGCEHLKNKLDAAKGNVEKALLLWNGGGNKDYPKQVLARVGRYR